MAIYDKWISLRRVVSIEVGKDKSLIDWFSVRLLLVCLISVPVNLRAAAVPLHPCDTLAANPNDTQAVSEGIRTSIYLAVSQEYKEAAVRACQHAIEQYPDEARFQYQYGRMLLQSDQGRAMEWMERAADQNYLAAQYTVGKFRLIKKNYAPVQPLLSVLWPICTRKVGVCLNQILTKPYIGTSRLQNRVMRVRRSISATCTTKDSPAQSPTT